MNVFVEGSSKLHYLVRKHFGEQFAVYGRGSKHQFCNHAKVFNTKQKQKQQREVKTYWAWQHFFCCNAGISADRCSNEGLPIWVPCANIFNFGSLCKYVLAQGAVVARFGRNFITSLFGFSSSWVHVLARNSNNCIGISEMVKI